MSKILILLTLILLAFETESQPWRRRRSRFRRWQRQQYYNQFYNPNYNPSSTFPFNNPSTPLHPTPGTCTRVCQTGFTLNTVTCSCECTTPPTCVNYQRLNRFTCSCYCPQLYSPTGQTFNTSTCSCDTPTVTCTYPLTADASGNCVCSITCPTGYFIPTGVCGCVPNQP